MSKPRNNSNPNDLPKTNDEWFDLLEKKDKNKDDFFKIARCYEKGLFDQKDRKIVSPNRVEAFDSYESAHELGHVEATYMVGYYLEHGLAGYHAKINTEKARIYYVRAATDGHVEAAYRAGLMYDNLYIEGEEVKTESEKKNKKEIEEKAKAFFTKASDKNHPQATIRLSQIYAKENNYKAAAEYAIKAAELGVADASPELIENYTKQSEEVTPKPNPKTKDGKPLKPAEPILSKL